MKTEIKILANNILYSNWSSDEFSFNDIKENLEKILLYLQKYPLQKYIENIKESVADWETADKKWIIPNWYPRVQKTSIKKYAIIVKRPLCHNHKDAYCELKSFYTFEEALKWVNE